MSERLQKILQHFMTNKLYYKQTLIRALAFLGLLTAGVNLLAWKLLYLPSIDGQYSDQNQLFFRNPSERGLDYNDIEIVKNGVTLKGWFIKQPNYQSAPTVVFFHENAGSMIIHKIDIGWRLEYLTKYYQIAKCNIVIVAYRGYNYSTGTPTQSGIQKDAIAIAEHTFENLGIDKSRVYAHGRSLGGAVATWAVFSQLQTQNKFKGLILENTFTSVNDVVKNMNFAFKLLSPLLFFNTWKTINIIGKIPNPIHFVSCIINNKIAGRDELIPYAQMKNLIQGATGTKQNTHYHIPKGDHNSNWLVDQADYFNSINRFIQQI